MSITTDKRWRHHTMRWVTPPDHFDPRTFSVDVVPARVAKQFVLTHHYQGTFPSCLLAVGLFGPQAELAGVAVFSECMPWVRQRWLGYTGPEGVELGRLVLLDSVKFNGETWFLKRAFKLLQTERAEVRSVLSFADPVARYDAEGRLVKPQHWGTIYQAHNALYAGRAKGRTLFQLPDGGVLNDRPLSKIRAHDAPTRNAKGQWNDQGWRYAAQQLLDAGLPPRATAETWSAWVKRATQGLPKLPHVGNLSYVFGLSTAERARLCTLHAGGLPYEKR